ncbi:hypothetical protein KI387_035612, partial [Taxus chinensis]
LIMSRSKYAETACGLIAERFRVRSSTQWIFPFSTSFHREMANLAYEEIVVPAEEEKNGGVLKNDGSCRAIILHGLMGSGRNWRNFARQLASSVLEKCPENSTGWRMVAVDLRNHGQSAGREGFVPPHDITAAARDVADLIKVEKWSWPDVVIGHSMGGKVALQFAESCYQGAYGQHIMLPKQLWVLDSVPGEVITDNSDGEVERVLRSLKTLPNPIPSRRWFVEHMMNLGFSKTLSDWLASNLKRVGTSMEEATWVFDLEGIFEMFQSYREKSYWSLLQHPPRGLDISIVRAEKSDRWHPSVLSQLESIANKEENADTGRVFFHVLKNAGHWLHIDNPKGLIDIMAPSLTSLQNSRD